MVAVDPTHSDHILHECRILVVEDDYFLAMELVQMLRVLGGEVIGPFADGKGALQVLAERPLPNAAVLDVYIRDGNSFHVADELSQLAVPFIFVTSAGFDIPLRHAACGVCAKPVTPVMLRRSLVEMLARQA